MHINYVMLGVRRTGGSVSFTEIGKRLVKKGHRVTITTFDDGHGVMTDKGFKPSWEPDSPIEFIPVYPGNKYWQLVTNITSRMLTPGVLLAWERINKIIGHIPECDINIATFFTTAFSVYLSKKGKAQFYHMQHYEPLFYDVESAHHQRLSLFQLPQLAQAILLRRREKVGALLGQDPLSMLRLAEMSYHLPLNRIANSSWLQKTLREKHNVDSTLINHAIRNDVFYPRPDVEKHPRRVLCLGKTSIFWKGVGTLADALKIVSRQHSDVELVLYGSEKHPEIGVPHRYVFNPTFEELAGLYCSSRMVVCPSWYESFPAPPLEGMSCGVPVVTTSIGTEDYARNDENCLVVPPRDPAAMAGAILKLLNDDDLCHRLSEEGLKTAQQFTWDITADRVETLFEERLSQA